MEGQRARAVSDDDVILAITKADGNITLAAQKLGISRQTIYDRRNENPAILAAIYDQRRALFDLAITALRKNIKRGREASIIYALKISPIAREEGYTERTEITGAGGGALQSEIIIKYADDQVTYAVTVADADKARAQEI